MRDTVCIVLNEREPEKAALAEKLQKTLAENEIGASRLKPESEIEEELFRSPPPILVLDYLLGDYSTGLDVLNRLNAIAPANRPAILFLTDEPEVQVAVDAMKLGARNYFSTANPKAIEKLLQEILQILRETKQSLPKVKRKTLRFEDLIFEDEKSRRLLVRAKVCVARKAPLLVLVGAQGSGRTTLANSLVTELQSTAAIDLDLAFFSGNLSRQLNWEHLLGAGLSAIIERAEEDDGGLIDVARAFSKNRTVDESPGAFHLILTTKSADWARALQRVSPAAEILEIPNLNERQGDFTPLAQHFAAEGARLSGLKLKPLEPEAIDYLRNQEWTSHLRQLRAIVIDGLIASFLTGESFTASADERLKLWETQQLEDLPISDISAFSAAMVLERFSHNYSAAAAYLGIGTGKLFNLLNIEGMDSSGESGGGL